VKNAPLRHATEYALFAALAAPLRGLPHAWARPLGGAFGLLAWALDGHHRRVAARNLALAFPALERDAGERSALVRACFRHYGAALASTLSAERFDRVEFCRRLTIEGWEHLDAAAAAGHGTLVMSAHVGEWEAAAQPVALYRGGMAVVGRPADNPHLDRRLRHLRERFGNSTIDKRGAARPILRTLERGGTVGILVDQRVRREEGILVPFFGRPAWTTPILARVSLRTGAPVVPLYGFAAPDGGWRVVFRPPIEPGAATGGDEAARAVELTRRYLEAVEREVRADPALWFWLHDRWRDAPAGIE
jgi:KDO2-lipid IV(A) lauroyltransferase